uniref:Putative secreted protein n=1 Tax=Anopheles darlingi TaxID=43151 RepID=A0A2M4DB79_ANODA
MLLLLLLLLHLQGRGGTRALLARMSEMVIGKQRNVQKQGRPGCGGVVWGGEYRKSPLQSASGGGGASAL